MEFLKKSYVLGKGKTRFQWISTDSIEGYITQNPMPAFRLPATPLYLAERIRQAARRLVAIPGRGGDKWQVIALEENRNEKEVDAGKKWVRRIYAPDRGNIILGLVKVDASLLRDDMREVTSFDEPNEKVPSPAQEVAELKIDEQVLENIPEWKGRFWLDEAGRIRSSRDKRPECNKLVTPSQGQDVADPVDLKTIKRQKGEFKPRRFAGKSWKDLLTENKKVVDELTLQRIKSFGLDT